MSHALYLPSPAHHSLLTLAPLSVCLLQGRSAVHRGRIGEGPRVGHSFRMSEVVASSSMSPLSPSFSSCL